MTIYAAWLDAIDGRPEAAIESLETFIRGHEHTLAAAEAADVLAILYLARDNQGAAKRSVDYGLATLKYLAVKTDYLETLLRRRLVPKVATSEAERLYRAAEQLRQAGKHQEAATRFLAVRQKHADSVWADAAGFRIGQCLASMSRRPQAIEHWQGFVTEDPSGPWRGQAHVALIDDALESSLDLAAATTEADAALAKLSGPLSEKAEASWAETALDLHLRQAIIAFVDQRYDAASNACSQALGIVPKKSPGEAPAARGHVPTGIEQLIEVAKSGRSLTPDEAKAGDPKAKLILMLADVHVAGREWTKAIELCDKVIESKKSSATSHQRSWAYHQKASAIYGIPDCKNAYDDFLSAEKASPSAPWAAESLLYAGCIANNFLKDDALALTQYQAVVARHPTSEVASKAAFFVGVTHESNKEWDRAKAAYTLYLRKYPDAPWTNLVKNNHLPEVEREIAEAQAPNVRATKP